MGEQCKYRVELKPVRKYRALFEGSLEECEKWMDENLKWIFSGGSASFQKRCDAYNRDVELTTQMVKPSMMNANGNAPIVWSQVNSGNEGYELCHRRTP